MKKILSFVSVLLVSLFAGASIAAAAAFIVPQGGTGQTTLPTSQLLYGATTGAVQSVATTTLTASSPLSLSQTVVKVGGANSVLSLDTSGTWTGLAGTASALAANGSNCSAGQFPLGVGANGASESCTALPTTIAGTANQITASGSTGDITLSLPSHVIFPGNFKATNSTTTNATTTAMDITGLLTFNGVTGSTWAAFCTAITGGSGLCDGTDATGGTGSVATSSAETSTYVAYWTSTGATPATLGSDSGMTYTAAADRLTVVNASTTAFSTAYASSTVWRGGGLVTDCDSDAQTLGWDLTTGQFVCGDDDSGVGGGITTIKEDDSDVVTSATALDFGSGFDVAAVVTEGNVTLDLLEYNGAALLTNLTSTGNASTTKLSANLFWAGQTATTSISSGGDLTVGGGDITLATSLIFSGGDTTSLNLIDAIDGTTESTIETAIDTLANLTSVQGQTLTLAGAFITSGANSLTLTTTGTTNVTLPTSGTLVNSAVTTLSSLVSIGTITTGVWNGTVIDITRGGFGAAFTDPNADQLMFWDDSAAKVTGIATITGGSISGTTLTITDVTCTDCLNATEIEDIYLLNSGDVGTGVYDFGGATSLEIPQAAAPTMGAAGILALDTTANNLILATSTAGHVVIASATTTLYAFTATTSPIVSGTTMDLPSHPLAQVATAVWCKVSGGTSLVINLSDGTNDTNAITCTTTGTQFALTSNNSFTAYEAIRIEYGTKTGDTGDLSVRFMGYRTSD